MKKFKYVQSTTPTLGEPLIPWLQSEFRKVSQALQGASDLELTTSEPAKLYDGMLRFADGTTWDPGAGRGVYYYDSGAWVKL